MIINHNSVLSVRLQAGHTYLCHFTVGTSVSMYAPQGAYSDFFTPDSPHDWGVRPEYVMIEY